MQSYLALNKRFRLVVTPARTQERQNKSFLWLKENVPSFQNILSQLDMGWQLSPGHLGWHSGCLSTDPVSSRSLLTCFVVANLTYCHPFSKAKEQYTHESLHEWVRGYGLKYVIRWFCHCLNITEGSQNPRWYQVASGQSQRCEKQEMCETAASLIQVTAL